MSGLLAVAAFFAASPALEAQVSGFDQVAWTFGELTGPAERVVGSIEALVVSEEGRTAVIDGLGSRIGLLAQDGRLLGWVGREGDGPEEFRYPRAAAFLPDGDVIVMDQGHTRLVTLGARDGRLQFLSSIPLPFWPWSVCTLGERLYVAGFHQGFVVHEVSANGEVLRSFGRPVQGPDMPEQWQANMRLYSVMGELLCVEEHMLVVHVPDVYPTVRAFDQAGRLAWTTTLEPWHQWVFGVTDEGRFQMAWDEDDRANSVDELWSWDGETIVVAVATHDPSRTPRNHVDAFLLDAATGEVQDLETAVPRMAGRAKGGVIAWEVEPFPRVLKLLRR